MPSSFHNDEHAQSARRRLTTRTTVILPPRSAGFTSALLARFNVPVDVPSAAGCVCVCERDYGTPIASAMAVPTSEGVNAVVSITSASAPSHPRNALSYGTR